MYMSYTSNPKLPKLRMDAVKLVRAGHSIRSVARYYGYQPSTVMRWVRRADTNGYWAKTIPTGSSRPRHHPAELSPEIVKAIVEMRRSTRRGAEFLHFKLTKEGYQVSLSSVKRTLRREGLTYPSKWKKWHKYPPRPLPAAPGELVEIDTIFDGRPDRRLYVYTCLDVCSRWAQAQPTAKLSNWASLSFIKQAQTSAPFKFKTIQSDHGPEFAKHFTKQVSVSGMAHRHSRVRTPNDNAHLERFNRTLQDECLIRLPRKLTVWETEIPEYIRYYNADRPHMGLNWQTPEEVLRSY